MNSFNPLCLSQSKKPDYPGVISVTKSNISKIFEEKLSIKTFIYYSPSNILQINAHSEVIFKGMEGPDDTRQIILHAQKDVK